MCKYAMKWSQYSRRCSDTVDALVYGCVSPQVVNSEFMTRSTHRWTDECVRCAAFVKLALHALASIATITTLVLFLCSCFSGKQFEKKKKVS